ncbi:hypothetical protein F0U59_07495 [Archangium gephyra]|nr:hypothetical protein F0U59_07495 [Archangium gephyra]
MGAKRDQFGAGKTVVIGEEDLWGATKDGGSSEHEMGQSRDLLYSIHESGKSRGIPSSVVPRSLMKTGEYVEELQGLRERIQEVGARPSNVNRGVSFLFLKDRVFSVTGPTNGRYEVVTVKRRRYNPRQIIIASGPGPGQVPSHARQPDPSGPHNPDAIINHVQLHLDRARRGFAEILDGVDFLTAEQDCQGQTVVINGGSATASWAAARAVAAGATNVLWMARSSFNESNPAGRNNEILTYCGERGFMKVGEVTRIEILDTPNVTDPRLRISLKQSSVKAPVRLPLSSGVMLQAQPVQSVSIDAHRYIYALGLDPTAPGGPAAILPVTLRNQLVPKFDFRGRFSDAQDLAVVALASPDESLWVVGASVFRGMGRDRNFVDRVQKGWKKISSSFAEPGTPFEGITVAKAAIKVVTGYYEVSTHPFLNWNTADRVEMAAWLRRLMVNLGWRLSYTDTVEADVVSQLLARDVIEKRSKSKTAWTLLQFGKVVQDVAIENGVVNYNWIKG